MAVVSDVVAAFAELFQGRPDAYGNESGCVRGAPDFERHLKGHPGDDMGIYPLVPTLDPDLWWCRWGCIDLDVRAPGKRRYDYETEDDAEAAAANLIAVLERLDIDGWYERTKSGGAHVWVFADARTSATNMRQALLVACQVAGVPPTEVNPKSDGVGHSAEFLSNFVRLPYPLALTPVGWDLERNGTRAVAADGEWLTVTEFVDGAIASRSAPDVFAQAAALYVPPPAPKPIVVGEPIPLDRSLERKLNGLAFTMLSKGPLDSEADRSGWLFRLASECHKSQLSPSEAVTIVTTADNRWTLKYSSRPDAASRIERTVEMAYR